jgi:hypothetical protein
VKPEGWREDSRDLSAPLLWPGPLAEIPSSGGGRGGEVEWVPGRLMGMSSRPGWPVISCRAPSRLGRRGSAVPRARVRWHARCRGRFSVVAAVRAGRGGG